MTKTKGLQTSNKNCFGEGSWRHWEDFLPEMDPPSGNDRYHRQVENETEMEGSDFPEMPVGSAVHISFDHVGFLRPWKDTRV